MKRVGYTLYFEAGEKCCELCGEPLPAFKCTKNKKRFICSGPACRKAFFLERQKRFYFGAGEKLCQGPGCGKAIKAGWHGPRRIRFFCSAGCEVRFQRNRQAPTTKCAYCGAGLVRYGPVAGKNHFCNARHLGAYRSRNYAERMTGKFLPLFEEYLDSFGRFHYMRHGLPNARARLAQFLRFLVRSGIDNLEKVNPKTITRYVAACQKGGFSPSSIQSALGYVSVFMNWLILEKRRKAANPVIPKFHSVRVPKRLPRPYSDDDMACIWRILASYGDAVSRLAVAIGEECGLRIGEVANLRVQDVDLAGQRLFIRLPTKTDCERWVPFHEKVKLYLGQWLIARDQESKSDHLLLNTRRGPFSQTNLIIYVGKVFGGYRKKPIPPGREVFPHFSFHRLRHRMASYNQLLRGNKCESKDADLLGCSNIDDWAAGRGALVLFEKNASQTRRAAGA